MPEGVLVEGEGGEEAGEVEGLGLVVEGGVEGGEEGEAEVEGDSGDVEVGGGEPSNDGEEDGGGLPRIAVDPAVTA